MQVISIHAPHTRSDVPCGGQQVSPSVFQSTLLIRGATSLYQFSGRSLSRFQSTLLIRGATLGSRSIRRSSRYFNPRSSYEERQTRAAPRCMLFPISIHAPHTRSDLADLKHIVKHVDFNPRSSYEERPAWHRHSAGPCRFQSTLLIRGATGGFVRQDSIFDTFQSTLLIRGATSHQITTLSDP